MVCLRKEPIKHYRILFSLSSAEFSDYKPDLNKQRYDVIKDNFKAFPKTEGPPVDVDKFLPSVSFEDLEIVGHSNFSLLKRRPTSLNSLV